MEENKSNSIKEEWRDIAGYEGFYQISNLGRVKSVERYNYHLRMGHIRKIKIKERIRKIVSLERNNFYCNVCLCKDGKKEIKLIHRLVAQAFIENPKPDEYNEVDHINHDVTDNRVTNLRWVDRSGNMKNSKMSIAKRERLLLLKSKSIQDKMKDAMELFEL